MNNATATLIAAASIALAGCAGAVNGAQQAFTVAEEHPISVDVQTITMTVAADGVSGGLSGVDAARVRAFAEAYMRDGQGDIAVTTPSGGSDGRDAELRQALYDAGVPWASMAAAAYRNGAAASRDIILSYTKYVATPSACGVWADERERDYRNIRSANFGCATQNNLAAMIANPRDLVEAAEMSAPDSAFRIRGVNAFRQGESTSTQADSSINAQVAQQ